MRNLRTEGGSDQSATQPRLAVDLGDATIHAALIDSAGQIIARQQALTGLQDGVEAVLDRVAKTINMVAIEATIAADTPVGVALAESLQAAAEVRQVAPTLDWRNLPLRDLLTARIGKPVTIDSGIHAGTYGEWRYGAGQGANHFIFINCDNEVSAGIVIDGHLLLGQAGRAGAVGHMVITVDGPQCHCGGRGCVETYVGGWAIESAAAALLEAGMPSILTELMAERGEKLSGPLINYAAAHDDGVALEVLARAGRALGFAVASLIQLFNPEIVAIGGDVISAGQFLFDPLQEALAEQLLQDFEQNMQVVPAVLGRDARLLGAAALTQLVAH